jgi:predicted transcriptional regulator
VGPAEQDKRIARRGKGFDVNQIANDVGMSRQTVGYYMRFKDQMGIAAEGRSRLKLVAKRDYTAVRRWPISPLWRADL